MRAMHVLLALFCVVISAAETWAQEHGNVEAGHTYAQAHCSECHGVEDNQDDFSPNLDAPDFTEVANTPGMTGRALAVWLQTSHPTMPNLIIPDQSRDDLVAYIMSLKKP